LELREGGTLVGIAHRAKKQDRQSDGSKALKDHCRIPEQSVPETAAGQYIRDKDLMDALNMAEF
jgi:hypothetical protein